MTSRQSSSQQLQTDQIAQPEVLRAKHGVDGEPLKLSATPQVVAMLEETFDLCGADVFLATLDRVELGLVTSPVTPRSEKYDDLLSQGRKRLSSLKWRSLQEDFLTRGLVWRCITDEDESDEEDDDKDKVKVKVKVKDESHEFPEVTPLTARAAYTLAEVCWRVANDPRVRAYLRGKTMLGELGLDPPLELPDDAFELIDHALAVVATAIVSDGVRDALRLLRKGGRKWYEAPPGRILWKIYTSPDGPALIRKSEIVRKLFPRRLPADPNGRGQATHALVAQYQEAATEALSQKVLQVVEGWCAGDTTVICNKCLAKRAAHWASAALIQVNIWLGTKDRDAHGYPDTPW